VIFLFRKLLIVPILLLLLLLPSCRTGDHVNHLSHQTYPHRARGILTHDGTAYEVVVSVEKAGDLLLQIVTPEPLSGAVFELREGDVIVSCGALTEVWQDGEYAKEEGILLCARMFSLSGDDYRDAGVRSEDGISYSYAEYRVVGGTVTVYRQKGLSEPSHITATLNGHELSFRYVNE
jgi:hypothetical protein